MISRYFFMIFFFYIDVVTPVTEEIVQVVPTWVLTNYLVFVGLKLFTLLFLVESSHQLVTIYALGGYLVWIFYWSSSAVCLQFSINLIVYYFFRAHPCSHKVMHHCHSDENCPPCTALTEKYCHGKHELRKSVACHIDGISCGRPCGKASSCGRHPCNK